MYCAKVATSYVYYQSTNIFCRFIGLCNFWAASELVCVDVSFSLDKQIEAEQLCIDLARLDDLLQVNSA